MDSFLFFPGPRNHDKQSLLLGSPVLSHSEGFHHLLAAPAGRHHGRMYYFPYIHHGDRVYHQSFALGGRRETPKKWAAAASNVVRLSTKHLNHWTHSPTHSPLEGHGRWGTWAEETALKQPCSRVWKPVLECQSALSWEGMQGICGELHSKAPEGAGSQMIDRRRTTKALSEPAERRGHWLWLERENPERAFFSAHLVSTNSW